MNSSTVPGTLCPPIQQRARHGPNYLNIITLFQARWSAKCRARCTLKREEEQNRETEDREKQRLKAGGHNAEPDIVTRVDWEVGEPVGAAHVVNKVVERTPAQRPGVAAFWTLRIVFW